jgi:hypothetical protein
VRTRGAAGPLLDIRAEHPGGTTLMDGVIATRPVDGPSLVLEPPPPARWYAAVLRDDAGATAFSNALYRQP